MNPRQAAIRKAERMVCPVCGGRASFLLESSSVYGRDFGPLFICSNFPKCDARVGAHRNTLKPKGTLAGANLRELRKKCHDLFDPLWRSGELDRSEAYRLLAKAMNITTKQAHIAMFTEDDCRHLLSILTGTPT